MKNTDQDFLEQYHNGTVDKNAIVASAIGKTLGARIIKIADDALTLTMSFEASPDMLNGAGVVQGGQLASMLDFAMALLVINKVKSGQSAATISINTDFLNPTKTGTLLAQVEIARMGRSIAFTKGLLRDESDTAIASATANMMIINS